MQDESIFLSLSLFLSQTDTMIQKPYHFFYRYKRHRCFPIYLLYVQTFYIYFLWSLDGNEIYSIQILYTHHLYLCITVNGELWIVKKRESIGPILNIHCIRTTLPFYSFLSNFVVFFSNFIMPTTLFTLTPSLFDVHFINIVFFIFIFSPAKKCTGQKTKKKLIVLWIGLKKQMSTVLFCFSFVLFSQWMELLFWFRSVGLYQFCAIFNNCFCLFSPRNEVETGGGKKSFACDEHPVIFKLVNHAIEIKRCLWPSILKNIPLF